ncbi:MULTISPECIES: flagellar type III secretion system pore protein FliP [Thermotoga]|jgi:flagellar biosynthetic protein FliP|uniref:Flagellar biosynthetic protein FliP n=1 Tax=Thermotoga neapolitana (strain ATCC 49049 / DSM 4359 / NBRC 107923 / NS-E) TaxID=309803 RepID=B9KAT0_THENN|nr:MULTISPECIES: flagellar type III secretion system pore protein FliP [Thermotoga]MDK2785560.1 flagellar biosynthesis protein FliP [Thermotoga sp.]HBF10891.1 flagellar biosynthetic protein FliP [Thermotoga neapolitana]ACM24063.1 Flagellar biosynthesis protein FliP [Thermotoga neapolitana DSM 4359]AJG40085.1 flagellar biosynthesis protein flip [Thermotoga sp. RQ7]KFZ20854.1 flagellar biosynthesis protein FliP [Thermotoga neapolitana LA10]
MRKILVFLLILLSLISFSQEVPFPSISIGVRPAEEPEDLVVTLEILLILTVLTLAPSILVLFTSFTRIIVVFSLFRNALGTRQTPPNQVMIGLALFLTFLIMQPVWNDIYNNAITPYLEREIGYQEMFQRINNRIREFMIKELKNHHNEDNVFMLAQNANLEITRVEEAPNSVLIPAFVLGELEIAFKMGVVLYVPFIVIDMIVASILLSMGMIMIPPVFVSLPFKILIFVMANGWDLLVEGLIKSFAR